MVGVPGGKDAVALPVGQRCSLYIVNRLSPQLGTTAGVNRCVLYGAKVALLWVPMSQHACMALIQALCWVCLSYISWKNSCPLCTPIVPSWLLVVDAMWAITMSWSWVLDVLSQGSQLSLELTGCVIWGYVELY